MGAVCLSHLHFDHCGQCDALTAPVYVHADECDAARTPGYTVLQWAAIPGNRLRLVHGDELVAERIQLVATPGRRDAPNTPNLWDEVVYYWDKLTADG